MSGQDTETFVVLCSPDVLSSGWEILILGSGLEISILVSV